MNSKPKIWRNLVAQFEGQFDELPELTQLTDWANLQVVAEKPLSIERRLESLRYHYLGILAVVEAIYETPPVLFNEYYEQLERILRGDHTFDGSYPTLDYPKNNDDISAVRKIAHQAVESLRARPVKLIRVDPRTARRIRHEVSKVNSAEDTIQSQKQERFGNIPLGTEIWEQESGGHGSSQIPAN